MFFATPTTINTHKRRLRVIYNPKDDGEINEESVILQNPFKQEISNKPIQNFPIDGEGIYRDGNPGNTVLQ